MLKTCSYVRSAMMKMNEKNVIYTKTYKYIKLFLNIYTFILIYIEYV
jgi:hypothetical protein